MLSTSTISPPARGARTFDQRVISSNKSWHYVNWVYHEVHWILAAFRIKESTQVIFQLPIIYIVVREERAKVSVGFWNSWLTKWQSMKFQLMKLTSRWSYQLMKWPVDDANSWWNGQSMKSKNDHLMKLIVDEMTWWWNNLVMKWPVDEVKTWLNYRLNQLID